MYTFSQTKDWVNELSASLLTWKLAQAMCYEEKTTTKDLTQKNINVVFHNFPILIGSFLILTNLDPCMCKEHQAETEILGGSFFPITHNLTDLYYLNRIFQYCSVSSEELKTWGKASGAIFCSKHSTLPLTRSCSEDPGRVQRHHFLFLCAVLEIFMGYSINKVIYSWSLQFFFQKKWTGHDEMTPPLYHSRA